MNHSALSRIIIGAVLITLSFPISSLSVYAQHYSEISPSNGQHVRIDNPKDCIYTVVLKDGNIQTLYQQHPDKIVLQKVTFKDQHLAAHQVNKLSLQKAFITSFFAMLQVRRDFFRIALNTVNLQMSIRVALQCKHRMKDRVWALSMVKHVSLDRDIKANLKESVYQIKADVIEDNLGYKDKVVLAGNGNKGIDYNNPALGEKYRLIVDLLALFCK